MNARNKPFVLGVTGGICCGKSTISGFLKEAGCDVFDADLISHRLTEQDSGILEKIKEHFGSAVFDEHGKLNRHRLGEIVFADEMRRRELEGIMHPAIQREMMSLMERSSAAVCVLDVPLLYETAMDALCDEVWVAYTDQDTQIRRICARDHLTRDEAIIRIKAQMPVEDKIKLADKSIDTTRSLNEVHSRVSKMYQQLIRRL